MLLVPVGESMRALYRIQPFTAPLAFTAPLEVIESFDDPPQHEHRMSFEKRVLVPCIT